jgi:hypothetical protein
MAKRIYRVVSVCGALGYGYPKESLETALEEGVDAILFDGGSMDAGPYYLGMGTEYFERDAMKLDFRNMVEAGQKTGVPVILGSCGMAGGNRNLECILEVAKEVFAELSVENVKVVVIGAELDVISEFRKSALRTTGHGPDLDEDMLCETTIVFHRKNVAKILNLPAERVAGTFVDSCNAIKISIDRPNISASFDERDVIGAQQQAPIESLSIPMYVEVLDKSAVA